MGVTQVVLSASRTDLLLSQTDAFDVLKCFDRILGISDFYAGSKVDMAKDYIQTHHVEKGLFIGDTVHDAEVAAAIGCDCILIARGHQSKETLFSCGVPVIEDIRQVLSYLK
jgi:phosphoglycolate phosphatase